MDETAAPDITPAAPAPADPAAAPQVGGMESFLINFVPILVIMVLFYLLLILPQQKRMKEHANMLAALKVGDRVVTSGGLLGRIETLGDEEAVVDLDGGVRVTALRATLQARPEVPSNDAPPKAKKAKKA
ncbi:MAG TPA: preprotein translocase subunit YajC [Rhodospirillaceae bacterium]|jgi:preprotein translocase subunit YajC|nr:preprotein translocase subunit YajC [Alphaproteobacteria bacterium]HBH25875.1 preprotein translocase subunit YajC [Rhodospirillaceae bacterium]